MSRVICISREYGSGGHDVGVAVAKKLGIPCLDRELMERVIVESGISKDLLEKAEETKKNTFLFTSVYEGTEREFYGMSPDEIVYELEKRYILEYVCQNDAKGKKIF